MGSGAINSIVVQRADSAFGLTISQHRQIASAQRTEAVLEASAAVALDAADSSTSRTDFAQSMARSTTNKAAGDKMDLPAALATRIKGPVATESIRQVSEVQITEGAKAANSKASAQMHLSPTGKTIFAVLDAFPNGAGPVLGQRPLFVLAAMDLKQARPEAGQNKAAIQAEHSRIVPGAGNAIAVDPRIAGGGIMAPRNATETLATAIVGGKISADEKKIRSGTGVLPDDEAGGLDEQDTSAQAAAIRQVERPSSNALTAALREVLKNSIVESGLFYEAHLKKLVLDPDSAVQNLQREPQGKLDAMARPLDTEDSAKDQTFLQKAFGQEDSRTEQNHHIRAIVRQQLDLVSTQTIQWQGQVWPQANVQWEIRKHSYEKDGQSDPSVDKSDPTQAWSTSLILDLPNLGNIEVKITIQGDRISTRFAAAQSETILESRRQEFGDRMKAIGMDPQSITFARSSRQSLSSQKTGVKR